MRSMLAAVVLVAAILAQVQGAFGADEPPTVRTMAGRHQQVGNTEVSGAFSATLFADGSFTVRFNLDSLDCDFINFRANHEASFIEWSLGLPLVITTFRTAGGFTLDAATLVLDAPLWIHPSTGALINRGLFRRCGVDDMLVAFRLTIRSANFAPLGRYDGDISATLLSGATLQRSFSGTFSAVSPMPFRPVIGFRVDPTYRVAGECLNIQWQSLPGAAYYALEYVGPSRRFTGRVFSATPELERNQGWGSVLLPSATAATVCTSQNTPGGRYELRVFGLDGALNVAPGTGSSVPVTVSVSAPY
ncbi:hypothetical protein HYW67_00205 [Candidatus Parcubacteria bacterium]|nr:hypothetical protein [Candidatus Parcubacteria bacterium]